MWWPHPWLLAGSNIHPEGPTAGAAVAGAEREAQHAWQHRPRGQTKCYGLVSKQRRHTSYNRCTWCWHKYHKRCKWGRLK